MNNYVIEIAASERLFWTMGNQNITISRAIAEFVDNSYDARLDSTTIDVTLLEDAIEVRDTSSGMNLNDLKNALAPADSKRKIGSVGGYGFGLKTASAFLGDCVEIETATAEMKHSLYLKLQNPFKNLYEMSLYNFSGVWKIEVNEKAKTFKEGTVITVSNLKRPRREDDIKNINSHFSKTFSQFLIEGKLTLKVNNNEIVPYKFDTYWKEAFNFTIPGLNEEICDVSGWVGVSKSLIKSTTSDTENGFHLYLNGRLLDYNIWIGLGAHPEMRLLVGEIFLQGFRSNITKTEIIKDSFEYLEFVEVFEKWLRENSIRAKIDKKTKEWTKLKKKQDKEIKSNIQGGQSYETKASANKSNSGKRDTKSSPQQDSVTVVSTDKEKVTNSGEIDTTDISSSNLNETKNDAANSQTDVTVIRNNRTAKEIDLFIKTVRWKVLFITGGKYNQICDINHYNREITLDLNNPLISRYMTYISCNPNFSKQVLYTIFAVFNNECFDNAKILMIEKLNDVISFRGE
ncbi:ATP-binding protein [Paenibacillus anaericanus]|nr:ATP-binding protein [Paenibacillus anaericanus]